MSTAADALVRIEWAQLEGTRPRSCGKNARLADHGSAVRVPVGRVTTASGATGTGLARIPGELAQQALGVPASQMFDSDAGTLERWMPLDYPLFDLAGKSAGMPVHRLLSGGAWTGSADVPCYDTSLYFDDLTADPPARDHAAGAAVIAAEAAAGYERGHRAFKVKVGRGARWMEPADGLDRDIAVVRAVRDAIGAHCQLFADANDGYTLNIAKRFLEQTAADDVGWLEEPFREDPVLLEDLRSWIQQAGLSVLVADGESASPDEGRALAARGLVDLVQCDILRISFTGWLRLGRTLDQVSVRSAPHHFGLHLGNFVSGHLAAAVSNFAYIEWDEAQTPGLHAPGYQVRDGRVRLPDDAGFGIELDDELFAAAVRQSGYEVRDSRSRLFPALAPSRQAPRQPSGPARANPARPNLFRYPVSSPQGCADTGG